MRKLLFFFSLLAIGGCNMGSTDSLQSHSGGSSIVGTWEWVNSEGGFRGGTVTPADAGYHQHYQFRSDSTFTFTRVPDSSEASRTGSFKMSRMFYPITKDTQTVIAFFNSPRFPPEIPWERLQYHGSDTILIGEDATDGIIDTYVRSH
jgi:hypothetical protein